MHAKHTPVITKHTPVIDMRRGVIVKHSPVIDMRTGVIVKHSPVIDMCTGAIAGGRLLGIVVVALFLSWGIGAGGLFGFLCKAWF